MVATADLYPSIPRCVSTDGQGHFELSDVGSDVEAIIASAPGHLPGRHSLREGGEQGKDIPSPVTMILESGGVEVFGSVLDATGGSVPFAVVTIRSTRAPHATTLVQSDSNGEFTAPAPEGEVDVMAVAEAYSRATRRVHAPARGVTLMLAPSAEVVGRVVAGDTDEPIAGVSVFARPMQGDLEAPHVAISDADGAFRVVGLSGAISYEVEAVGSEWRSNVEWVRLGVGQQSEPIVLRASAATTLTGTVLLEGEPCQEAHVMAAGPVSAGAYVEAKGGVRLDGLLPGRYHVLVRCTQGLPYEEDLEVATEPVSRDWAVDPGLTIKGRVENARGQPVSATVVVCTSVDGGLAGGGTSCTTTANGHFTCSGMHPGAYDCRVDQDADPSREVVRVSLDGRHLEPVSLRTRPSGSIRASVNNSDTARRPLRVLARREAHTPIEAVPGTDGFTFRSLPLGRYEVYLDAGEASRSIHLERDEQVVEIELDAPDYALSIQGRALDEHGTPLADAWVSVSRSDSSALMSPPNEARTLTDEQGSFTVPDLARGTYILQVKTVNAEGELRAVAAGSTGVVVHVPTQT